MANKPAGCWLNETAISLIANNLVRWYIGLAKSQLQIFNGCMHMHQLHAERTMQNIDLPLAAG